MSKKADKCLVCKTPVKDRFWLYLWRREQGHCCETCGHAIHDAGYKVLDSLAGILKDAGLQVGDYKEKFGYYRLSVTALTPFQVTLAHILFSEARSTFSEFSFDFSVWYKNNEVAYNA